MKPCEPGGFCKEGDQIFEQFLYSCFVHLYFELFGYFITSRVNFPFGKLYISYVFCVCVCVCIQSSPPPLQSLSVSGVRCCSHYLSSPLSEYILTYIDYSFRMCQVVWKILGIYRLKSFNPCLQGISSLNRHVIFTSVIHAFLGLCGVYFCRLNKLSIINKQKFTKIIENVGIGIYQQRL